MRLVILNPHANQCGNMVFNWLFRFPQHQKYTYLWREAPAQGREVAFLADGTQSSFYQTTLFEKTIARVPILLKLCTSLEFWLWKRLNAVNSQQHASYISHMQLNPDEDIVLVFGFTDFNSTVCDYKGIVLVHLSHYHLRTEKIANFFSRLSYGFVVAEGDVARNDYFTHYFPGASSKTYLLPFTFEGKRFKRKQPFQQRKNTCFACGPMSVPSSAAYVQYYGRGTALNPMRQALFDNQDKTQDTLATYIYPHAVAVEKMRKIQPGDSAFTRVVKRAFPAWVLTSVLGYKLPYYSFNIVEKYNQHMMFCTPEERTGIPSMKLFEGILCGSILVGIDDPMYTLIGFQDGVNYIAYKDANLKDLVAKITYYQNRPQELERIATSGYELVMSRFTPARVAEVFWQDLEGLLESFRRGRVKLNCSFIQH
ncbi:MAG: glycosyltransferase [Candidatus Andersenbacteria bacterium]